MISSLIMVRMYGYYYLISTAIGSVVFYFVNMLIFVDYTPKNNVATNVLAYVLVVATILIILFIGINFMRSTLDPPNYRIDESRIVNASR